MYRFVESIQTPIMPSQQSELLVESLRLSTLTQKQHTFDVSACQHRIYKVKFYPLFSHILHFFFFQATKIYKFIFVTPTNLLS